MFKRGIFLLTIVISIAWVIPLFAGPNMKEGLWEITTKVEIPGMPFAMPPRTYTQCITKEDLIPQKPERSQECEMISRKIVGDTVLWTMECQTPEGTAVMNGKVTYKGETFDGETKMKTPDGTEITHHISGRRIGECKK